MKSRAQELVDKSVAAMIAAIEIYNKPDFKYREETFSIIAINAWELLLKAKWLAENKNRVQALYVMERKDKPSGKPYKHMKAKLTSCGNPFTHSLDYLCKKLFERGILADPAWKNIQALSEIRDSSTHFYNRHGLFAIRLQEVGSASVKNFVTASRDWFDVDLTKYNFYLMPLAFVSPDRNVKLVPLNREEKNLVAFITSLESSDNANPDYDVSVNIEFRFSRSKAGDALNVQLTNDPAAPKLQLTELQLKDKYPLTYEALTKECRKRYADFIENGKYHALRKPLKQDKKYCHIRRLDPDNPRSPKQEWFSRSVFSELDKHYKIK